MDVMGIEKSTAEREFLQYLHGYPGEPEWLTALLYGKKTHHQPGMTEMKQVSEHNISSLLTRAPSGSFRWNICSEGL